jgi:hypothetical protein
LTFARAWPPLALAAVVAAQMRLVSPLNFGGYDEWLIVHLTATGRYSIPYANRPLELFWDMPAPLLFPHRLEAFVWLHAAYLWLLGVTVWAGLRKLVPGAALAAFTAGALAATWAPRDSLRLNAIETVAYSGAAAVALAGGVLLWIAWERRSPALLAAGALLAVLAARTYESVVPLLLAAPALLWAAPVDAGRRAARWRWVAAWELVVAGAAFAAVFGVVAPQGGSYQMSALRLDLSPPGVAARLAQQAGFHLLPAVEVRAAEIASWPAAVAAIVFAAGALPLARGAAPRWEGRGLLVGSALAVMGWSVFALSPAIQTAERTQFLSAPGVAVVLAALAGLASRPLPAALRPAAAIALGAWIVAAGAGRTAAMQREWDASSYWTAQSSSLRAITALAPDVAPGTMVVLFDEAGAWPATFTFRHALQYLYDGRAVGHVVGAHAFLYPTWFTPRGAVTEPLPDVRGPWNAPPTLHRASDMVVLTLRADGSVALQETWPAILPVPDAGSYDPRRRLSAGPPPASRAVLR